MRSLKGKGLYVDCDVYCIRPILQEDYIVAFEDDNKINGAVLALPENSVVLDHLLKAAYDPYFIPPWYWPRFIELLEKTHGIHVSYKDMTFSTLHRLGRKK